MVYTERTDKCSTSGKDNAGQGKASSQKQTHSGSSGGAGSAAGAWSSQASSAEKWKYNDMVKDNRAQFNGMHFS